MEFRKTPYEAQRGILKVLGLLTECSDQGDAAGTYYRHTQTSADFAVENKKFTFLDVTACEKAKDRKKSWEQAELVLLPWWKDGKTFVRKDLPPAVEPGSKRRGTYNRNAIKSKVPRIAGATIHELFAGNLAQAAFPTDSLVPGRIFNPSFAIVGTRPDAVSVTRPSEFLEYLKRMYEIDPLNPQPATVDVDLELLGKTGFPMVLHEFKTIHSPPSVDVAEAEIESILSEESAEEEHDQRLFESVARRLEAANWLGDDLFRTSSGQMSYRRTKYPREIPARKMGILAADGANVAHLFAPQSGSIVVWDRTGRTVRYRKDYAEFPFVLSPASDHFRQMLQQRVSYHFLNPDVVSMLSVVFKFRGVDNVPAIQVIMRPSFNRTDLMRFIDRANQKLSENLHDWPAMKAAEICESFAPTVFSTINEDSVL